MKNNLYYVSFKHYMAKLDVEKLEIEFTEEVSGSRATLGLIGLFEDGKPCVKFSDYVAPTVRYDIQHEVHSLHIVFQSEREDVPSPELHISVNARGITMYIAEIGHYEFVAEGYIFHGGSDAYAINTTDTTSDVIRAAIGPAASKYDNAIYDRNTDTAFEITNCRKLAISYDFENQKYKYKIKTKSEGVAERIKFAIRKNLLADKYDIDYVPMKLGRKYKTAPAGFMTWYSLKFDACETRVLENAAFQSKYLKDFGANTVWVDWEWCHRRYERERFDGVDNFNPDPQKYPHGLAYLAEEIKKLGMVPALWIGFTNDACLTEYEKEHPEISLSHHDTWSGRYYYDFSNPEYLNGYLVKAIEQVKKWGYESIKYDTLPNGIYAHENYHANMLHPERTTYSVYRDMIKKTRELLGEDVYMLSCGSAGQVVLWGTGCFDAARIGPDLFTWEKYVETVGRMRKYYALHSNTLYCDPDCVVLRDEYSTYEQAKSRIVPVSLLGLPLNFGDELTKLPEDRIDLLKCALPTINAHPTDFNTPISDEKTQLIVLKVAKPFETYSVLAIVNLSNERRERRLSLSETLRLEDGKYLVFDYFNDEFLGVFDGDIILDVAPYDTRLVTIRRLADRPQLLSSSRHFTQGAAEIEDSYWQEEDSELIVKANLIGAEKYTLTIYAPDGYTAVSSTVGYPEQDGNVVRICIEVPCTEGFDFIVKFTKTH